MLLLATGVSAPTFATEAEPGPHKFRFFSMGWRYDKESIGVVSPGPDTFQRWSLELSAVETAVTTPAFSLGRVRFDPTFKIAGGLANAEMRIDSPFTSQTLYTGLGMLFGAAGAELAITPCGSCPASMAIDSEYRTIFNPEPFDRVFLHADLEHYREYGGGVRFSYAFAGKRFTPHVGMRWTHTDANVDVVECEGTRPVMLDHDRLEPFGGFDFQWPHLLGGVNIGSDWLSVSVEFPIYGPSPQQHCGAGLPPCDAGQFCSFPPNAPCGSATISGTCKDRPPLCDGPIAEVCGCDEKTYKNVKCANNAGVSVASPGPCADPCKGVMPAVVNGGFENGTTGWTLDFKGPAPEVITAATPPMNRQGKPIAPYCGSAMLRISDLDGDAHTSSVSQKFILPENAGPCAGLRIHWGAMLEDGGHESIKQPYFEIAAKNGEEQLYYYRADATNAATEGWSDVRAAGNKDPVWYRDGIAEIGLPDAAGDTIEVKMTARDCTDRGHGGAAFIDCVELIDRCTSTCAFPPKMAFGELHVPNFFSPDGNHINDLFEISSAASACSASMTVYDRWGKIVATPEWQSISGAPNGRIPLWNGIRDNGDPAMPADNPYYYVLKVSNCSETKEVPGFVYIFLKPGVERGDLLHVVGSTEEGGLWHTIRYDTERSWQGFGDVEHVAQERGQFDDVDAAFVKGELHTLGVTKDGTIWHAIRHGETTGWQPLLSVNETVKDPGKQFLRLSAADVGGELHVCAIGTDKRLWHTIRGANGWQFFGDVLQKTGPASDGDNAFVDVGCTAVSGELHVLVVNESGNLFHTIRHASGWQPFLGNVRETAPPPALTGKITSVGAGELNGALHVCMTTDTFKIYHTIRQTGWQFLADVMEKTGKPGNEEFIDVSCRDSRGELHLVAVSKSGELWHTIRHDVGWDKLGNIEDTYAGERGKFIAVGIDGVRIE